MDRVLKVYVLTGVVFCFLIYLVFTKRWRTGVAFLIGWCVPGLGHLFLGRWKKAIFFFGVLGATLLAGLWLTGFRAVGFDDNPFYFVGQYGSGLTMLVATLLAGKDKAYPREDLPIGLFDPGLLYVCVAGLLNFVVALSCLEIKPPVPVEEPKAAPPPEAPPKEVAAP